MCAEVYPACHLFVYNLDLFICYYGQISQHLTNFTVLVQQSNETMWIRKSKYVFLSTKELFTFKCRRQYWKFVITGNARERLKKSKFPNH